MVEYEPCLLLSNELVLYNSVCEIKSSTLNFLCAEGGNNERTNIK